MTQVKGMRVRFGLSPSPDVQGYAMYMEEEALVLSYESERHDLTGKYTEEGEFGVFEMTDLPGMTTKDGIYNLGIVAIDDAGNESSMSIAEGVVLDFVAPDPPGVVIVERC